MEVEHFISGDGEEIGNILHRNKKTVDNGWPDVMEGILSPERSAEKTNQARQRRQRYIDNTVKRLRRRYLKQIAQEYLMKNPNASWNDFWSRIIYINVSFQVSSNFFNTEGQTKDQTSTLGQEIKNQR